MQPSEITTTAARTAIKISLFKRDHLLTTLAEATRQIRIKHFPVTEKYIPKRVDIQYVFYDCT
jgi:hypothetical protein